MDFPYAIEGGSTIKFFWVLNKLYMAKREAILTLDQPKVRLAYEYENAGYSFMCFVEHLT